MPEPSCPFCQLPPERLVWRSELVLAVRDQYPVSRGHTLLIPKRHVETYFDASPAEQQELWRAVEELKREIDRELSPDGYNVGFNAGAAAGQTVMHLHVHLIPRYRGDMTDPRGGIRGVIPEKQKYSAAAPPSAGLFEALPRFVGGEEQHLVAALRVAMQAAEEIDIVSAFLQPSGFRLLRGDLEDALHRQARVRILTGDYLSITHPDTLGELFALTTEHPKLGVWVYECKDNQSFHPKSYLFLRGAEGVAYVGSSNLSASGITGGVEWNLRAIASSDAEAFHAVRRRFEHLLRHPNTRPLERSWLEAYRRRARVLPAPEPRAKGPSPTPIQREALAALARAREEGKSRGLVVLATGLGKTYLSAFDFQAMGGKRALFVAHREEILSQAREKWQQVFPERDLGLLSSAERSPDTEVIFASVQTLSRQRHLTSFKPEAFDYVVIDEFHHAAAATYRKLLAYFKPRFLLGLTATPDRMDGASLLSLCDGNQLYRKDLIGGIVARDLVPFRYYGVKDNIDFTPIPWRSGRFSAEELTRAVATKQRAADALREYERHAPPGPRRTLAFCCTIEHASFMADYFTANGHPAAAVHSGPGSAPRAESLRRLGEGQLEMICAVDIFNEGLDIPNINTVLMLRPTESPVIFLQQLGRGLRTAPGKNYLSVVDFIGNHFSFLQKPQALLSLLGKSIPVYAALKELRAQSLELPPGCHVEIETAAIDMLQALCRPKSEDLLLGKYYELRVTHSRRPTASELYSANVNLKPVRERYRTWFDFVAAQKTPNGESDLSAEEAAVLERHRDWFADLQKTRMTRSYKMIALQALLRLDKLTRRASIEEVCSESLTLLKAHPLLYQELLEGSSSPEEIEKNFLRRWRELSLDVWAKGEDTSRPWFSLEGKDFVSRLQVSPADEEVFANMTEELVELRLREHLNSLRRKASLLPAVEPALRASEAEQRLKGLALWQSYTRDEVAKLFGDNYNRSWQVGHRDITVDGREHTVLFVTLRKEDQIETKYHYADEFISRTEFQWESQDSTDETSLKGRRVIGHVKEGRQIHLFVRYESRQSFIYCGCLTYLRHEGNQPMRVWFQLERELPEVLWSVWRP